MGRRSEGERVGGGVVRLPFDLYGGRVGKWESSQRETHWGRRAGHLHFPVLVVFVATL
jgi:hypothetical protein